jgi:hypothetical protein
LEIVFVVGRDFDGTFLVNTEGATAAGLELSTDFFGLLGALSVIIKK